MDFRKVFLGKGAFKIAENLRENTHAKVQFIEITLWHGCSPVNCRIFPEHLFRRSKLEGCFWMEINNDSNSGTNKLIH